MANVTFYGSQRSRTSRVTWCAREIGIPFEQVELTFEQMKGPEYLAINPAGKVPTLIEGDLKLFESLAINLYLAKKYATGELYPTNLEDEARVLQWTLWAATEAEPKVMPKLLLKLGFAKDEAAAAKGEEAFKPALKYLDDALKGREWLVGNKFSIADLNVAAVVGMTAYADIDISSAPNVVAWLARCNARPARNG
jgi:glutathione S-transferase